jgi:hypothetical protein
MAPLADHLWQSTVFAALAGLLAVWAHGCTGIVWSRWSRLRATVRAPRRIDLGLKLESSRGPVEMFVINRVERPTEN